MCAAGSIRSGLQVLLLSALLPVISSCATPPPAAPLQVKLAAFNDFHGNIEPPTSRSLIPQQASGGNFIELPTGGVEYLGSAIAQLQAQNPLHAVVAAGDLIGGSPLVASLFRHEPTIELLSQLGLEFTSVGNHEFDAGWRELLRIQQGGCAADAERSCRNGRFAGAQFQYLAANVIEQATGKPLLPAYAIKEFKPAGGKPFAIAFIGLVTRDTPNLVIPSGIAGLRFADEADSANALVPELRARGIESIVVLIHEGGETSAKVFDDTECPDFEGPILGIVERLDPAIDVVISGHSHKTYVCRHDRRLITSAGAEGRFVTDIDLTIDPATHDVRAATARQIAVVNESKSNPLPQKYPTLVKDPKLSSLVRFYNEQAAPLAQRRLGEMSAAITRDASPAGQSALGSLVADAHLTATRSAGAQIAFMNRGGVRTDLRADGGYLTYSDVFAVHPFGNSLITLNLTGAEIDTLLEQQWTVANTMLQVSSGFSYEWDAKAPAGQRVDIARIRLDGVPIDPARVYRVTVNDFLAQGGEGFTLLKQAGERTRGIVDVEALEQYVTAHSPLLAPTEQRIVRRN